MTATTWGKWFWADWRSDPALRACGPAARGIWMDMLCLMAEASGYLLINGNAPDDRTLARVIGATEQEVSDAIEELGRNGVFSRDRRGVIYCRRMVRAEKKASTARENGKNGGNPALCKDTEFPASDNQPPTEGPTNVPGNSQKPDTRYQKKGSSEPSERTQPQLLDAPASSGKGCRLPADWRPSPEAVLYARQQGFGERPIERMAENFRDYWVAASGANAVKRDWTAAWRTWVRREAERHPPQQSSTGRQDWI